VIDFIFLTQTIMVEIVNNRVSFVDGVQTIDPINWYAILDYAEGKKEMKIVLIDQDVL
jgi:hypothetical protein